MSILERLIRGGTTRAARIKEAGVVRVPEAPEFVPGELRRGAHGNDYFIHKVRSMDSAAEERRGWSDYVHLSSLISGCVRREVLASMASSAGSSPTSIQVMSGIRLVWALGRAAERHVRDQFIRSVNYEGVLGQWRCRCSQTIHNPVFLPNVLCPTCDSVANRYSELTLFDDDVKISGSPDFLYNRPDNGRVRVVEIKSMNKKDFDLLECAVADHVIQATGYARLLIQPKYGIDVDSDVSVVYVCKDFSARPYKEFHYARSAFQDVTDNMWGKARTIKDAKEGLAAGNGPGPLPARLSACATSNTSTAKGCDLCSLCFSV